MELVGPVDSRCTVCDRPPQTVTHVAEPLLRHGGYGEARLVTLEVCCGVRVVAVESQRPERGSECQPSTSTSTPIR